MRGSLAICSLLLALAAAGCNGPFLLLPGGALEGESRPVPAAWDLGRDHGTAQLETRPGDPYSNNVGFTLVDGRLYVSAGGSPTHWSKNIDADPRVRLRIDGVLYDLRAERVSDPAEIEAFGAAWVSQSLIRRDPRGLDEVWIYRLVAR